MEHAYSLVVPRKQWLARSITTALLLAGIDDTANASTFTVTSCGDSPVGNTLAGTLRAEVTQANFAATSISNDFVDLKACKGSVITLSNGAIAVTAPTLSIGATSGVVGSVVTILPTQQTRIFNHTGTGTLGLEYVRLEGGEVASATSGVYGGCVYSAGTVTINRSTIDQCAAYSTNGSARGGAVYARAGVTLAYGVVSNSYARSTVSSLGGGIDTPGTLVINYSTVTGNRAGGTPTSNGYGGGVFGTASTTITHSTIDNNYAKSSGGGLALFKSGPRGSAVITDSTISGNIAHLNGGAGYVGGVNIGIYNSTIAFNSAGRFGVGKVGGLYVFASSLAILESSVFANNSDTLASPHDLYVNYSNGSSVSAGGGNNLARSTNVMTPGVIISSSDPLISPLANHGGSTRTHALLAGSPAIDTGRIGPALTSDQRGTLFPRISGSGPDIGAYERQASDDEIFYAGLEANPGQVSSTVILISNAFSSPTGVAVDASGNVFVADLLNNAIKEVLSSNGAIVTVGSGFSKPSGLTIDKNGNVFVADTGNNAVEEIQSLNGTIPSSPTIRNLGSSFNNPEGVAVDDSGNVFVADTVNNAIKELLAVNGIVPASPTIVTLGSGFNHPFGVAVDHDDNVYVADSLNGKVKELLKSSNYTTINPIGMGFVRPCGIWVDPHGNVFVADSSTNNVSEISADHTTTTVVGGAFYAPEGVSTDASGNIFVADSNNNAVKEIANQ